MTTRPNAGFVLLGVSADPPERLAEFRDAHQVNHDPLSTRATPSPAAGAPRAQKVVNGERTTGPLRSTFILDADGIIQLAQYQLDPHDHVHGLLTQVGA